jgi:hypothetical protein
MQCYPILLVGCVFNGDSVVTFTDFTVFLRVALALLWNIYKSRRGSWIGEKHCDVIMQQTTWVSATIPSQSVLKVSGLNYVPDLAVEPRSTRGLGKECTVAYPAQPLDNVLIVDFVAGHP